MAKQRYLDRNAQIYTHTCAVCKKEFKGKYNQILCKEQSCINTRERINYNKVFSSLREPLRIKYERKCITCGTNCYPNVRRCNSCLSKLERIFNTEIGEMI